MGQPSYRISKSAPTYLAALQQAYFQINRGEGSIEWAELSKQYRIGGGFRVRSFSACYRVPD
jgi:hypothetical protein